MTENLVYWAQALDNASPDQIDLRGEELSSEDTIRRQEAVSMVSSVVKSGWRIFSEGGVQLTADGHRFVAEVPSAQRDEAGRIAPIVCCGEYGNRIDEVFVESVAVGIDDFAHRIGRTIDPEHFKITRRAFAVLKKKASMRKRVRVFGIGALAFVLLALVYVFTSRGS
jgi:hypothetical protein